jgi:polysaccharide export outer membrane protein
MTNRARFLAASAFAAALLTLPACADRRGGPIAYNVTNFGTPDAPVVATVEAGYRIAPRDTVSIKVFRMPDLSGDFEVDAAGQISVPLIGRVLAANLTTVQLDQALTEQLGDRYLENPDVSVAVKPSTTRTVTIDGAVNSAGAFPVTGPLTLMQAIALGQGAKEDANLRRVAVFRQIEGKRQAAAFDLTSIRRGEAADPAIFAGDIIIVDGSSIKAAQKQIINGLTLWSIFRPF